MKGKIFKNLQKDILIENRNRAAISISFTFTGITTLSISMALGGISLTPILNAALFWIMLFFSGMSGLAHIFIREEEEKNSFYLNLYFNPEEIYISKLLFNMIFFLCISFIQMPLYIFFLQLFPIHRILFFLTVISGSIAISSVSTILGAIVSKSGNGPSLFTILAFPLLLPVLWVTINLTKLSIEDYNISGYQNILFLLAFSGLIISVSYLSFKYIWMES